MNAKIRHLFDVGLALAGPLATVAGLHGQQAQGSVLPTRVPVTIAWMDSLPGEGAPFRILRREEVAPHDVILLRAGADGRVLSQAIHDLLAIRAQAGDTAKVGAVMRVRRPQNATGRTPPDLPWAGRVIQDLRRAQPQTLPGVGTVPMVEIWLPPQRGRMARP